MTRQGQSKIVVIKKRKRHAFWWTPEFVPVELFKVKKYSKARKGFEFLKLTAKHTVLENLKKSWKVMEFEELKRERNPLMENLAYVRIS